MNARAAPALARRLGVALVGAAVLGAAGCQAPAAARAEANKLLVRRYLAEVVNTGDVAAIDRFVSPDYAEHWQGQRYELGIAGARDHVLGVRRTWPDLQVIVGRQLADGEWVASEVTARGTHLGEWRGIAPTGRPMVITGVNLDRIVAGRIVEHGGAANLFEALLDAGAVRVVGPATDGR
ncbi:MAG: ester cyclase [Planctomycetes bacterium]|nr:ester cyclase [Planctomycetota bacterium]